MATDERTATVRMLRALAAKHAKAVQRVAELEEERAVAYATARALEPQMTFKEVGEIFHVSEAAVMQHLTRRKNRTG